MSLDAIPRMFRPDSFPSYLTFEEGPEYDGPPTLAGRQMDPPAALFNQTFNSAIGGWGLPRPEIEDGTDGDVGQSEAEIVQQVYLKARGPCQQFEMFFTAQPMHSQRNSYGQANRIPYEGLTLNEMQLRLTGAETEMFVDSNAPIAWNSNTLSIQRIVKKYNPMGFFFAYVEDRVKNQSGMDVAYTCGSLCDILNIWHVPIVPGMQLYVILMWVRQADGVTSKKMFVPYASLGRPEDDYELMSFISGNPLVGGTNVHEWALINIGTVCVASNQPAQMLPGYNYVCLPAPNPKYPSFHTSTMSMTTDPVQIKHNILRVNVNMLQWEYHTRV